MATASVSMQSVFVGPSGGLSSRNNRHSNQLFFKRNPSVGVRCMAQEDPTVSVPSTSAAQPQTPSNPSPVSNSKVSTKFRYLLAFSGPAPERINGRLAMVGFMGAIAVELSKRPLGKKNYFGNVLKIV